MAPDFVDWLFATFPRADRTGRVFRLIDGRTNQLLNADGVSRIMEDVGRKAGMKVGSKDKTGADGKNHGISSLCWVPFLPPRVWFRVGPESHVGGPKVG